MWAVGDGLEAAHIKACRNRCPAPIGVVCGVDKSGCSASLSALLTISGPKSGYLRRLFSSVFNL